MSDNDSNNTSVANEEEAQHGDANDGNRGREA
jgi:hypothetical protein